jgi:hypothetical protein
VLAGPQNAGRVLAWVGMAMFAAMALGAPIGTALYSYGGFIAVAIATAVIPLLTILLVAPLASVMGQRGAPAGFMKVAGAVWLPGVGSALSSVGFGAVLAFSSLLATEHGWNPVWLTFTAFAFALVAARLFFGHVPDRLGGARVALACIVIEAAGLALIWFAPRLVIAAVGAALTGFGYSLVYPGLGVEAVRRAPPQSRGLAMGAYTVFLDVALGLGSPLLGLVADWGGFGAAFLTSAIVVLGAAVVAIDLLATPSSKTAAGDLVKFPERFEGGVKYATVERGNIKEDLFTSPETIAAVKAGHPVEAFEGVTSRARGVAQRREKAPGRNTGEARPRRDISRKYRTIAQRRGSGVFRNAPRRSSDLDVVIASPPDLRAPLRRETLPSLRRAPARM